MNQEKDAVDEFNVLIIDTFKKFYKDSILRIISGICHELKSPLQAISSSATVVKEISDNMVCKLGYPCNNLQGINEFLFIIDESSNKISEIINLLSDSLREYNKDNFISINVDDFLGEILNQVNYFTDLKHSNIKIEIKKIKDIPKTIITIPSFLKQSIINVLSNSINAIIKKEDKTQGIIRIILDYRYDYLEILIEDNGCGIPEEDFDKIFEPFFTSKSQSSNCGLGLFVSQNLMNNINGNINLISSENGFTIMKIKCFDYSKTFVDCS